MPEVSAVPTISEWERWILDRADYFTVVERIEPGRYDRKEFPKLKDAIKERGGNARVIIYAVMRAGRSFPISPKQYSEFLVIRGESQPRKRLRP